MKNVYPDADRLVLVRGGGENVKTGEKGEGYDDSLFAPMAEAFRLVICHNGLKMLQSFSILRH